MPCRLNAKTVERAVTYSEASASRPSKFRPREQIKRSKIVNDA
jgi:hypothetical protein